MKLISPYVHGWLDYVTMIMLLIVPLTLKMNGRPEFILIGFALFEFILAVMTAYPLGATRQVPFPVHGIIDLISGVALIAAPFLIGFTGLQTDQTFFFMRSGSESIVYFVLGAIYLLVWVLTDFRGSIAQAGTEVPA